MQEALKMKQQESCTQFEITTNLLRNLYKFNLTPVTKLVLLELTTHLNENKNGSVVFPSVSYIAEVLGIGLTAAKKAINDLIKEGIIIKTKRNNVKGNYNKYLFTQKITSATIDFKAGKNENRYIYTSKNINSQKIASKPSENELFKPSDSDLFLKEQKKKINKEQTGIKKIMGGNVYEDEILRDYAIKHGARNVNAYVNTLKNTESAAKIIKEYKQKQKIVRNTMVMLLETQKQIQIYQEYAQEAVEPETSTAWQELGKKLGIKK